ncbi:MAG: M15 family metallopeptidase [Spirochaetes bacterium]|nr:M15 family metallopeptidase [Spirochaetota bacterium]
MKASQAIISGSLLLLFLLRCACEGNDRTLFGAAPPADYLTGRFNPSGHELFVSLADLGIPTNGRPHRLRREAAAALKELYAAFRRDHPKAPFWVQSSTRTYNDQKYIWNGKWTGRVRVGGRDLSREIRDPVKRAVEILRYSSMPGTSRHHWGTDIDLNVLSDAYYAKGAGALLYRWMAENAPRYGFCQPYTAGRGAGYCEEKWHWSYVPLSKQFLSRWNSVYRENPGAFSRAGLFSGSEIAGKLAAEYMNAIHDACR